MAYVKALQPQVVGMRAQRVVVGGGGGLDRQHTGWHPPLWPDASLYCYSLI